MVWLLLVQPGGRPVSEGRVPSHGHAPDTTNMKICDHAGHADLRAATAPRLHERGAQDGISLFAGADIGVGSDTFPAGPSL